MSGLLRLTIGKIVVYLFINHNMEDKMKKKTLVESANEFVK